MSKLIEGYRRTFLEEEFSDDLDIWPDSDSDSNWIQSVKIKVWAWLQRCPWLNCFIFDQLIVSIGRHRRGPPGIGDTVVQSFVVQETTMLLVDAWSAMQCIADSASWASGIALNEIAWPDAVPDLSPSHCCSPALLFLPVLPKHHVVFRVNEGLQCCVSNLESLV